MAKLNKIYKSYAEICVPAVLYLIVGLFVVAIEFYYYTLEPIKTRQEIVHISVKLAIIIFVTIVINYLCYAGYTVISIILALVTSGYLLLNEFRTIQQRRSMTPVSLMGPPPVQRRVEAMTNAFDTPSVGYRTGESVLPEVEYRLKQIVPVAQMIGQSTQNAYN